MATINPMQAIPITKEVEQAFGAVKLGAVTQRVASEWVNINPVTFGRMYRRWIKKQEGSNPSCLDRTNTAECGTDKGTTLSHDKTNERT